MPLRTWAEVHPLPNESVPWHMLLGIAQFCLLEDPAACLSAAALRGRVQEGVAIVDSLRTQ